MPDIILSLPNSKQLEVGDFDLDQLVKRLTEVLADESRRSEIQKMTGDNAVLVIECLDRVSEIRLLSWSNVLITPQGHLIRHLQSQFGCSNTLNCALHDLKTLPRVSIPPLLLLDRSKDDNTPRRALHIWNLR